jgi:hypothetical protein
MPISIPGNGSITGLSPGGLPDGSVANNNLVTGVSASKLSGALPAISGAALTNLSVPDLTVQVNAARNDIATLALHSAVADNKAAYNLANSFVDQFEDSSGILTNTDVTRNAGEYTSTLGSYASPVYYRMNANASQANGATVSFSDGTGAWESGGSSFIYTDMTTSATGSGWWAMSEDSTYQLGGRHTIICQSITNAGGSGPSFTYGFSKNNNVHTNYQMNDYSSYKDLFFVGSPTYAVPAVGFQIREIYDPIADENLIDGSVRTSNSASWTSPGPYAQTKRPLWDATTISTLYHGGQGWKDSGSNWTIRIWSSYEAFSISATGALISNAQTANAAQTKVSGVIIYKNNAGTATLNTDLKLYFSCDNGTNWTQSTMTSGGTFSTGILVAKGSEVTCTSGANIKYKIEWANQASGTKETQLHGIGVNY